VNSTVPLALAVVLTMAETNTNITVTGSVTELVEATSIEHTGVDRGLFEELPLESQSSSVSSLITLAAPGVVADSNGPRHNQGGKKLPRILANPNWEVKEIRRPVT
jgi:hypothetical protein